MAIDTEEKRRAALTFMLTPWIITPTATGTINDEDRAIVKGCYFPGAFPPAPGDGKAVKKTSFGTGFSPNV